MQGFFRKEKLLKTQRLTVYALVCGMYVLLSFMFAEFSFGPLQFRPSELLNLLAFYHPGFVLPISLGCAISNFASPFGLVDVVVGTLHTFLSLKAMTLVKKDWIAALFPALFAFIIGLEIYFLTGAKISFFVITAQIMASELILGMISVPFYRKFFGYKKIREFLKGL